MKRAVHQRLSALKTVVVTAFLLFTVAGLASAQVAPDQGLNILNRSCTGCHSLRAVEVQAMDSEGWLALLNRKIDDGVELNPIEQLILLDYLVRNHGPVPEGPGRELLLNRCTVCHNLDRVRAHRGTRELWEEALSAMLNEGAFLTDAEFATLVDYLTEHFGPGDD